MNSALEQWLARARTPQTRARIRLWTPLSRVVFALTLASWGVFVVLLVGSIVLAIFGFDPPVWVPNVGLGVATLMTVVSGLTWFHLEAVRYADGEETVGVITEVVPDDPHESNPSYRISLTAEMPDGAVIHRVTWKSKMRAPIPGQRLRFRHNTRTPDDTDDILFLDFEKPDAPEMGRDEE